MGHPQRPREQTKRELLWRQMDVALGVFKPLQAGLGGALQALDHRAARGFIRCQRRRHTAVGQQCITQRNRVFQRQLGSRANRKVRSVYSIPQQHDVLMLPALTAHDRKASPQAAIAGQLVTPKLCCKERFAVGQRGLLVPFS